MADYSNPASYSYQTSFGFQQTILPSPTVEQRFMIKNYEKASRIGYAPSFNETSFGYNSSNINVSWTNRSAHKSNKESYNQQYINFFNDNATDIRYSVVNTVASFGKESDLDCGIVINFIAG